MKDKLRLFIQEDISKIFEDDYISSFEPEDIPEMQPGGVAHQAFLKDLWKEPSMGKYKDPSGEEVDNIIKGLQQGNLDLPNDYDLTQQAEKDLQRKLNSPEKSGADTIKDMEKLAGAGSYNESIRKIIREQINTLFEINAGISSDTRQIAMARKLMGDDSIIVLNKLKFGEELSMAEESEARDKYFTDYIITKTRLGKSLKRINPINLYDLEALFERGGYVFNSYLSALVERYSNVEQISNLERNSLLNTGKLYTPENANDNIAKKYIIKMFVNLDVPQADDNKWTQDDSMEASKAYQIALSDGEFRNILEQVLYRKGMQNSRLYKKLKSISDEIPATPSALPHHMKRFAEQQENMF